MAWAWVRTNTFTDDTSYSTSTFTLAVSTVAGGNLLVLAINIIDGSGANEDTISSITDSASNTWAKAVDSAFAAHGYYSGIWYAQNVSSTAPTLTVHLNVGTGVSKQYSVRILEYSGIDNSQTALDVTASLQTASGTSFPTGTTAATATANELAIATYADNQQAPAVSLPGGWNSRLNFTTDSTDLAIVDKDTGSIGTQSATFTSVSTHYATGLIATFRAAPATVVLPSGFFSSTDWPGPDDLVYRPRRPNYAPLRSESPPGPQPGFFILQNFPYPRWRRPDWWRRKGPLLSSPPPPTPTPGWFQPRMAHFPWWRYRSALMSAQVSTGNLFTQPFSAALSFVGIGPQNVIGKSITAALSFVGAQSRGISKGVTATLSFVGSAARVLSKNLTTATLSFVGVTGRAIKIGLALAVLSFTGSAPIRSVTKGISASVSFVGAQSKAITKGLVAALLTFAGSLSRLISKSAFIAGLSFVGSLLSGHLFVRAISASLSFAGSAQRNISHLGTATLSFVGTSPTRVIGKGMTAALSFAGVQSRAIVKTVSAALLFTGTLTKNLSKLLGTAILSFTGNVVNNKVFLRALTATLTLTGAQARVISKGITATLSFAGAQAKAIKTVLTAALLSFVGTVNLRTARALTATLSFVGTLVSGKFLVRALVATLTFTGAQARSTGKIASATLTFVGAQSKAIKTGLPATLSFVGNQTRRITKILVAASLNFVGVVLKATNKKLVAAGVTFVGSILGSRIFTKILTAVLTLTGSQSRRINKGVTGGLSFAGNIGRATVKGLNAALAFVGNVVVQSLTTPPSKTFTAPTRSLAMVAPIRNLTIVAPIRGLTVLAPTRALTAAALSYPAVVLSDAPVGYWRLIETSGTTALDSSGSGFNGSIAANVVLGQTGLIGDNPSKAMSFTTALTNGVTIPYTARLHPGPVFSAEFWMANPFVGNVGGGFFDNSETQNDFLMYGAGANPGHMYCRGNAGAFGIEIDYSAIPYNDGTVVFHHWVWSRNGNGGTSILYRDGVAVVTTTGTVTISAATSGSTNLGFRAAGAASGQIQCEFALYNYALSSAQVVAHYNAGIAAGYVQSSTLTAPSRSNTFMAVSE